MTHPLREQVAAAYPEQIRHLEDLASRARDDGHMDVELHCYQQLVYVAFGEEDDERLGVYLQAIENLRLRLARCGAKQRGLQALELGCLELYFVLLELLHPERYEQRLTRWVRERMRRAEYDRKLKAARRHIKESERREVPKDTVAPKTKPAPTPVERDWSQATSEELDAEIARQAGFQS